MEDEDLVSGSAHSFEWTENAVDELPPQGPPAPEAVQQIEEIMVAPVVEELAVGAPSTFASPVHQSLSIHAETTIASWFADSFNKHLSGAPFRPVDLGFYQADLLRRLGLRG